VFGRSKTAGNPLWELRASLLAGSPELAAIPLVEGTSVRGVLMETGHPEGPVTLLVLGDGTTSLYLPNGGGIIGAGEKVAVRAAGTALMITADALRARPGWRVDG
jgi:hypothetical protein